MANYIFRLSGFPKFPKFPGFLGFLGLPGILGFLGFPEFRDPKYCGSYCSEAQRYKKTLDETADKSKIKISKKDMSVVRHDCFSTGIIFIFYPSNSRFSRLN